MIRRTCWNRLSGTAVFLLLLPLSTPPSVTAQDAAQTGTVTGRVIDESGGPVAGAQVYLVRPAIGTATRTNGEYVLTRVPVGTQVLHVRMLGFRPDSASVTLTADQPATQDFTLRRDPLQLQTMVVTGTQSPRMNLDASVAVTTLTATEIEAAAPRSTTEMLRYVPGFTRVESSGGEVNQNITMRGILGVEYVAFLEDGLPGLPHDAHVLHERRQPVPVRHQYRAHGGRAGRQLTTVRLEYPGRHRQLHQQDRRRRVRRHHARDRRAPRDSRGTTSI